jgi:hypothetical protein
VEGPGEYAPFKYLSLTVRQGDKIAAGPVRVSPGKTPSINVRYGSGYTLEVQAPVDRKAPGVKGFAKTYGGVSEPFTVSSSRASVPVPIQMTEPVQIEFSYVPDTENPDTGYLILFGNDFFRFNLYSFPSISFDIYGRMILIAAASDSMGEGLYFFDEYPYPLSFYDVPWNSVYEPTSGRAFYVDYSASAIKYVDLSASGAEGTYTYPGSDIDYIGGFAPDGQGNLFGFYYRYDENDSSYLEIKKYTIDHADGLAEDSGFDFKMESPDDASISQTEMRYISGRLVVIVSYNVYSGNSENGSHYQVYMIDPNDHNSYTNTPLFYLPGQAHVSGWDRNGINLYLVVDRPDLVTGDIPDDLYITWDAGFDSIPKASVNMEISPETIPAGSYMRMELYAYDEDNPVILEGKDEAPYYRVIRRKDKSAAAPVKTRIYGPIDTDDGSDEPLSLDFPDIEPGKYQILVKVLKSNKSDDYDDYIDEGGRAIAALDPQPWYDSDSKEIVYTGFTLFHGTPYMNRLYSYRFGADTNWDDPTSWFYIQAN